MTSHTYKCKH